MIVIHNPQKLADQLAESSKQLKSLNLAQLNALREKTVFVNQGVKEADPWIKLLDDEIASRSGTPAQGIGASSPEASEPRTTADSPTAS